MARRRGRPGDYLLTDDYSGTTTYRSRVTEDYWGNFTRFPLERNLQEIASPLNDPYPVSVFRGPQYERTDPCDFELFPRFIGKTLIPFNTNNVLSTVFNFNPAIPDMSIGCTFIVGPDTPPPPITGYLLTDDGIPILTDDGVPILV